MFGIRTGDLFERGEAERIKASQGISRQRDALCQFESGYQLQRSSYPAGVAASFVYVRHSNWRHKPPNSEQRILNFLDLSQIL